MKGYLSYFKLKFILGLQYRSAALAGILTQFFFGFIYVFVYVAFYESDVSNLPMKLEDLVSYVWLGQSLFSLVYLWYKDKEIIDMIKNGNIAYELCRPQNLYITWCFKILGERLAKATLRFAPVIVVAIILPPPYNFLINNDFIILGLFFITIILSTILMTVLVTFYHVLCLFTVDDKGVVNMFMIISDILSGLAIPIPFFPKYLQNISNALPFKYVIDFPFELYVGRIGISKCFIGIIMQLLWIIILLTVGKILANRGFKKAIIQGG